MEPADIGRLSRAVSQLEQQANQIGPYDLEGWQRYVGLAANLSIKSWAVNTDTQLGFDTARAAINAINT